MDCRNYSQLPAGTQLIVLDERWQYLNDRINLLLKNGLTGLLFVIIILYLFLNQRVAFWVTLVSRSRFSRHSVSSGFSVEPSI